MIYFELIFGKFYFKTFINAKPTLKKIRMGKIAMKKKNYH